MASLQYAFRECFGGIIGKIRGAGSAKLIGRPLYYLTIDESTKKAPSERGGPKNGEHDEYDHPNIFFFHDISSFVNTLSSGLFDHDHGLFFSPFDLNFIGGGHFGFKAKGPHHDDSQNPPADLPGPQGWKTGEGEGRVA